MSKTALREPPLGALLPALVVVLWEALARAGVFPPNWLPAPTAVAVTLYDLAQTGQLMSHILVTVLRVLAGVSLGASLATLLGAMTGQLPLARKLLDPLLQALRNIPSMAWVPLFLLWLGVQESSKIVQGKPFSTESHLRAKKRPAPHEQLVKEQLVV